MVRTDLFILSSVFIFIICLTPINAIYTYSSSINPLIPYDSSNLNFWIVCSDETISPLDAYLDVYVDSSFYITQSESVLNATTKLIYILPHNLTSSGQNWTGEFWCGNGTHNSTKNVESVLINSELNTSITTTISLSNEDMEFWFSIFLIILSIGLMIVGLITHSYLTSIMGSFISLSTGALILISDINYIPNLYSQGLAIILLLIPIAVLMAIFIGMINNRRKINE